MGFAGLTLKYRKVEVQTGRLYLFYSFFYFIFIFISCFREQPLSATPTNLHLQLSRSCVQAAQGASQAVPLAATIAGKPSFQKTWPQPKLQGSSRRKQQKKPRPRLFAAPRFPTFVGSGVENGLLLPWATYSARWAASRRNKGSTMFQISKSSYLKSRSSIGLFSLSQPLFVMCV